MNAALAGAVLSLADEFRVDEVCNDFEKGCQIGAPPDIEPFLARVPEVARQRLARELVALDVYYRGGGEASTPIADYQRRFPHLERAWLEALAGESTRSPGDTALTTPPSLTLSVGERPTPATPPGFALLDEVGRGGMGVVYRANDLALGREVAIKLLQDRFPADGPAAQRFLGEARITGQLQHPGIPAVHHIGRLADGRPFLAMKLIKGRTLDEKLKARPDPGNDRGELLANFAAICQAVGYAHAHNVIHRDLKPSNVMVGAFGEVQVMDWGLAKVLSSSTPPAAETAVAEKAQAWSEIGPPPGSDAVCTQAGSLVGTPAYIPPEQAAGELEKVDQRADVFGLGAILAVILTGQPPYLGNIAEAVRTKAVRGDLAECLARLDACDADPELVALCKRCLSPAPADRPRDAGEVARAVTAHLAAAEERARQAELDRVKGDEQRRRRRTQWALAGSVLLLVAAAAVGTGFASLYRVADREREKFERFEYGRTMQVAHDHWRDNNVAAALALLESTRPDLRGWEWHYLHRLCHSELLTLQGHADMVTSAAFNADGTRIVTGSHDRTAKVWNAETGAEVHTLKGHTNSVVSASFSADSSRIVTASLDKTAKVWDVKTGVEMLTLRGHRGHLSSAAFSADGSQIVTSGDGTARVWDATSGAEVLTLKVGTVVFSAAFNADSSRIVTGSIDGTATVWDANSGALVRTLKGHPSYVYSASFSSDSSRIVTASGDGTARVWYTIGPSGGQILKGHTQGVLSASFSADRSLVVTGSADQTAKVWDAKNGAELLTLRGHTEKVTSASFSADMSRIVTGSHDGTAKVWDARNRAEALTLKGPAAMASFSADGSRIVTGVNDLTATVWDARSGDALLALKGHKDRVRSGAFSVDSSRIVTASVDGTAKVWDAGSGTVLLTLIGHTGDVNSASFSPDSSRIVTASRDKTAKVWDAGSGADVLTLKGHTDTVWSGSFNADSSRIVTASADGTAKVWDARDGTELRTLQGNTGIVYSAEFSADSSRIVTGSSERIAKVWDARSGSELFTLKGHTGIVHAAAFSVDGSRIVTASSDGTVKLWDAKCGAEVLTLKGHTGSVYSASFSTDTWRLVTASGGDGTAKVWDSRPFRDSRPPDPTSTPARPPGS